MLCKTGVPKVSQKSQENICGEVSFLIKLQTGKIHKIQKKVPVSRFSQIHLHFC